MSRPQAQGEVASMTLESIAKGRVQEALLDEIVVASGEVPLTVVPTVGPEDWEFVVTQGRVPPTGTYLGGRVILGSVEYQDAALLWTAENGERYIHQVWVTEDLRGLGVARALVELYQEHVGGPVVWVGPFSPGGLALAKATGTIREGTRNPKNPRRGKRGRKKNPKKRVKNVRDLVRKALK